MLQWTIGLLIGTVFASILLLMTMGYIDIGLIRQVGRPHSGIYVITNVGFMKFATLENSNDEAGVAGVYPLLSGSYWQLVEVGNGIYIIRSLYHPADANYRGPFPVMNADILGNRNGLQLWSIQDHDNGKYLISPVGSIFLWGLDHGESGTPVRLAMIPYYPQNQWYLSRATTLQSALYYLPVYGSRMLDKSQTTVVWFIDVMVEAYRTIGTERRGRMHLLQLQI